MVAVVIEAIWHLGSAVEHPGGWSLSVPTLSGSPFALPDLSLVGAFSLDSFGRIGVLAAVMLVFTLVFANFFDAMGTFTGLSREVDVADERGTFPRLRPALIVEGAGAVVGGATSSSSNTVFLESAAGIQEGARTGLANLVTGAAVLRGDVRDAVGVDRADGGRRGGAGRRRRDDVLAPSRRRPLGVLRGACRSC